MRLPPRLRPGVHRSTGPQLQLDGLTAAGVDQVYVNQASGVASRRPELDRLLGNARPGDTLVIWRLGRLGRSMKHFLD